MRRTALPLIAIAVLAAVGACAHLSGSGTDGPTSPTGGRTGTPTSPPAAALALCRQALPDRDVVSGNWTTVGDLRTWGYGGPVQKRPLATAFPGPGDDAQAAWCWTRQAADNYTAWGVLAPAGPAIRAINIVGPTTTTPSGPPRIP